MNMCIYIYIYYFHLLFCYKLIKDMKLGNIYTNSFGWYVFLLVPKNICWCEFFFNYVDVDVYYSQALSRRGSLDWTITLFSLSTLPNTLVMGIPLLRAMYGDFSSNLMVQIVVLQSIIWYTLMLFLFEFRGAKLLISEKFPETAGSITSFRVDSDVISLTSREPLEVRLFKIVVL